MLDEGENSNRDSLRPVGKDSIDVPLYSCISITLCDLLWFHLQNDSFFLVWQLKWL